MASNVHLYLTNGMDLSLPPSIQFDFAFSSIVFQHIPSHASLSYA